MTTIDTHAHEAVAVLIVEIADVQRGVVVCERLEEPSVTGWASTRCRICYRATCGCRHGNTGEQQGTRHTKPRRPEVAALLSREPQPRKSRFRRYRSRRGQARRRARHGALRRGA